MRPAVCCLLLAACGRFHFDASQGSGADDAHDGDSTANDAASDANAIVEGDDALTTCFLSSVQLTSDGTLRSLFPVIAASPSEFGLQWLQEATPGAFELRFERFVNGTLKGPTSLYANATFAQEGSLIWDGTTWVAVGGERYTSGNDDDLTVVRVDPATGTTTATHRVGIMNQQDIMPSIVYSGSQYGLTWVTQLTVYYRNLDGTFADLSTDKSLATGSIGRPQALWDGSNVAVVYHSTNTIPGDVSRVTTALSGSAMTPSVLLESASNYSRGHVSIPGGYAFSYAQSTDVRVGIRGSVTSDIVIPSAFTMSPSLVWTGSELGVAYNDGTSVRLKRLAADGTSAGATVTVANVANVGPVVAFTNGHYAVAWSDSAEEIHVRELCAL